VIDFPTISVVIPCFNGEKYIEAAVRSALDQDWPNLEIVVVDDGSSDRSVELVRGAFPEVTLLQQPNQGVAVARNNGILHARGEWIAFLDADDIWLPGKLRAQWAILSAMPNARMSYTAWQVWDSIDPTPTPAYLAALDRQAGDTDLWSGPTGWIYPQLLLDCVVWTSTVLAHRTLFTDIGMFDSGMRIGEDYDLWLRASRLTEILRVEKPLALYRMHLSNITKKAPAENFHVAVVSSAVQRWGYVSPDGSLAKQTDVNKAFARTWRNFAAAHLAVGNWKRARQGAVSGVRLDPWHLGGWKILARTFVHIDW
jgi:glycosyltransferase involved in cell wall biosynthesis